MLNITAGNISSVTLDHLIQFLIEPSSTNAKLEQTCKLQQCYKNFDKTKIKNDLCKISWKENCRKPDSNVALEQFLQIINKLLDKHAPYAMSKSHSFFHIQTLSKTVWKTIKEIIKVKNSNDVPINSLLIGETITTNAKLIANHSNIFFTSVAAKLNEKIVKTKKPFSHYLGQTTDETIFLSPTTPADIAPLINCIKQ